MADENMRSLAERMRPGCLDQILGQDHLLGPTGTIRSVLNTHSHIWLAGPPGSGKTSIAMSIAKLSDMKFLGVMYPGSDAQLLAQVLQEARRNIGTTMVFVYNMAQYSSKDQELLIPYMSLDNVVICVSSWQPPHLVSSPAVLSRCHIFELRRLRPEHVKAILRRASSDKFKGLVQSLTEEIEVVVEEDALHYLSSDVKGNAKVALNALEIAAMRVISTPSSSSSKRGLLHALKNMRGSQQEYVKPFKKFQYGLQMENEDMLFEQCVTITLAHIQDVLR